MTIASIPFVGVGVSYRKEFGDSVLARPDEFEHLELLTDHYIDMPSHKEREARELAARFPVVLHGVDMSLGTCQPLDDVYLSKVARVAQWTQPLFVSDHLAFTKAGGIDIGQLTPLPFTVEAAGIAAQNIRTVAQCFSCPFLVENISYYFYSPPTQMSEADFLSEVVSEADCYLLLDLTNVDNNAINNGYDAFAFIDTLPLDRVLQIHLAGGERFEDVLLDTHGMPVPDRVFDLLQYTVPRAPNLKAVTLERDQDIPPIDELLHDLRRAREIVANARCEAEVQSSGD